MLHLQGDIAMKIPVVRYEYNREHASVMNIMENVPPYVSVTIILFEQGSSNFSYKVILTGTMRTGSDVS